MTKEEIKATVSVPEVLERYGVQIKRGRCKGFCHNGKDLNMGVRKETCHCFVCDKTFDVFGIVEFFENCDFKTAFEILGGNRPVKFSTRRKIKKSNTKKIHYEELQQKVDYLSNLYHEINATIIECNYKLITLHQKLTDIEKKCFIFALKNKEKVWAELEEVKSEFWNIKKCQQKSC